MRNAVATSGWMEVKEWIQRARNEVIAEPPGPPSDWSGRLESVRLLADVVDHFAYLSIDHGWLRVLGTGTEEGVGSLSPWLSIDPSTADAESTNRIVFAHDVVGGFFALAPTETDDAEVEYLAPDELTWMPTGQGIDGWLLWAFDADLGEFYEELRWDGWEDELQRLGVTPAVGVHLYPPPWAEEGRPVSRASRRVVPMEELWLRIMADRKSVLGI